jgi:hypothetical protein
VLYENARLVGPIKTPANENPIPPVEVIKKGIRPEYRPVRWSPARSEKLPAERSKPQKALALLIVPLSAPSSLLME